MPAMISVELEAAIIEAILATKTSETPNGNLSEVERRTGANRTTAKNVRDRYENGEVREEVWALLEKNRSQDHMQSQIIVGGLIPEMAARLREELPKMSGKDVAYHLGVMLQRQREIGNIAQVGARNQRGALPAVEPEAFTQLFEALGEGMVSGAMKAMVEQSAVREAQIQKSLAAPTTVDAEPAVEDEPAELAVTAALTESET